VYQLIADEDVLQQLAALPVEALDAYAELLTVLELTPWNGQPQHEDNPDGAVRRWAFGPGLAGHVVYLILEDQQNVHLLLIQWWD